jgi:hypothetical protein
MDSSFRGNDNLTILYSRHLHLKEDEYIKKMISESLLYLFYDILPQRDIDVSLVKT